MRSSRAMFGLVWLVAIVVLVVLVAQGEVPILPHAFLVAWLVLVSLPLGALPVLMGLEILGGHDHRLAAPLRLLLAMLPVLSLAIIPILLDLKQIYGWAHPMPTPAHATVWFSPLPFTIRAVVYLVMWNGFGLFFLRPARPSPGRRALAGVGLALQLVVGTSAAFDWFMSLDAGFVSSTYGVLVIAVQCALAIGVATLLALRADAHALSDRSAASALLIVVAIASYLQFAQYLVVWSANLPKEIVWYQTRGQDGIGAVFAGVVPTLVALAALVLVIATIAERRLPTLAAVLALVVATIGDLIVLASPGDTLTTAVVILDVVVGIALAGVTVLSVPFIGGHKAPRARHG